MLEYNWLDWCSQRWLCFAMGLLGQNQDLHQWACGWGRRGCRCELSKHKRHLPSQPIFLSQWIVQQLGRCCCCTERGGAGPKNAPLTTNSQCLHCSRRLVTVYTQEATWYAVLISLELTITTFWHPDPPRARTIPFITKREVPSPDTRGQAS